MAIYFPIARARKSESIEETSLEDLKLRSITGHLRCYIYNASKLVAKYVSPLSKTEFSIVSFSKLLTIRSDDKSDGE